MKLYFVFFKLILNEISPKVFFGHAPRKIRVRSFASNHAFWSGISAATFHATSKRYLWIEGLLFFKLICSRYWNKFSMTRIGNWSWEVNKVLLEFKCSGVCEMDRSGNPTLLGVDWNGAPDPKFLRRDSPKKMKLNFIKKTNYFIMSN